MTSYLCLSINPNKLGSSDFKPFILTQYKVMFLDFFLCFPPLRMFLNLTFGPFPPNFLQTSTLGTVMGATLVQPEKLEEEEEEDPILCCPAEKPGW